MHQAHVFFTHVQLIRHCASFLSHPIIYSHMYYRQIQTKLLRKQTKLLLCDKHKHTIACKFVVNSQKNRLCVSSAHLICALVRTMNPHPGCSVLPFSHQHTHAKHTLYASWLWVCVTICFIALFSINKRRVCVPCRLASFHSQIIAQ